MGQIYEHVYLKDSVVPSHDAKVSVASSAVLYGLSVYTVFIATSTEKGVGIFSLDKHFKRLCNSARIIGINTFEKEWTYKKFEDAVKEVIETNKIKKQVFVRATVHITDLVPGTYSKGLSSELSIFLYDAKPILPLLGARLKTSVWRRTPDFSIPSRAKVNGGYVNSVLAKQEAKDAGYDDAIFLNSNGQVAELSAANIFLVRNGSLVTPSKTCDILEGITRATVFDLAKSMNIEVSERSVDFTELYVADEVFACGTSAFITSIKDIDGRIIGGGQIGQITKSLQDRYSKIISASDETYLDHFTFV